MPCTYESNPHVARKAGADLRENNTFSFNGAWARASQTSNNGSTSSIVRPFLAGSSGECRNTKLHTLMKGGERKDVRNVAKKGTKPQKTSVWWCVCGISTHMYIFRFTPSACLFLFPPQAACHHLFTKRSRRGSKETALMSFDTDELSRETS